MKIRRFTLSVFALISLALIIQTATDAGMNRFQPPGSIRSQAEVAEVGNRVQMFLDDLVEDRLDEAVKELLADSPLRRDAKKLEQLTEQIQRAENRYGAFIGGEEIRMDRLGNSMIRAVHVLNCKDFPIIWRMMFYRSAPTEKWVVVSLSYDTNYENLPEAESPLPTPLQ